MLSSVGSQNKVTCGHRASYLDYYEFNDQLEVDTAFKLVNDTPFSATAFDDLEKGGSAEKPILLNEDEEKSLPTTPVSKKPTRPPALLRNRPFGAATENVPDCVYRNLLQLLLLCVFIEIKYN